MVRYTYSFTVWPCNTHTQASFALFRAMVSRVDMVLTEADFREFRYNLASDGLTLREVERVPYQEPETVL